LEDWIILEQSICVFLSMEKLLGDFICLLGLMAGCSIMFCFGQCVALFVESGAGSSAAALLPAVVK